MRQHATHERDGRSKTAAALLSAAAACLLMAVVPGAVLGDAASERLYSRGLVEYHRANYAQALGLFDRAVRADANDSQARYYRGVTRGKLGDYQAAADDLGEVVARDPGLASASLELGYALFRLGKHAEAAPHFQRARGEQALEGRASLFLGITELRRELLAEARRSFSRAARADPQISVEARFYQGVAAYRLGELGAAESHFRYVTEHGIDGPMVGEAEAYLAKLAAAEVKRYQLYARAGFEYDSNVTLEPIDDGGAFEGGDESDGRFTITAGGRYAAPRTQLVQAVVGYELFQSSHFSLDQFDIQNHRVSLDLASTGDDLVRAGVTLRYDHYLKDFNNFLSEPSVSPWLRIQQPGFGHLDLYYRWQLHRFMESPFDDTSDGSNHAVGLRQTVFLDGPDRFAFFGYRHDAETARKLTGRAFAYDGDQLEAGLGWRVAAGLDASLRYAYRHEGYDVESRIDPASGMATLPLRNDDEHAFSLSLAQQVREHVWLEGSYSGTVNNSNQESEGFQYERHVGRIALELRY